MVISKEFLPCYIYYESYMESTLAEDNGNMVVDTSKNGTIYSIGKPIKASDALLHSNSDFKCRPL